MNRRTHRHATGSLKCKDCDFTAFTPAGMGTHRGKMHSHPQIEVIPVIEVKDKLHERELLFAEPTPGISYKGPPRTWCSM